MKCGEDGEGGGGLESPRRGNAVGSVYRGWGKGREKGENREKGGRKGNTGAEGILGVTRKARPGRGRGVGGEKNEGGWGVMALGGLTRHVVADEEEGGGGLDGRLRSMVATRVEYGDEEKGGGGQKGREEGGRQG